MGTAEQTFSVHNDGDGELVLDPTSFSLPAGFALLTAPATAVVPGGSTSFTIRLDAAVAGQFQGQMSFATNVPHENPFQFWLYGQVAAPEPEVVVRYTDAYGYEEALYSGYSSVYFGSTVVNSPVSQAF
ncbi:MAG: choice-of-anchor D domain-containing protein [Planctomycetaceae bacterium]|nr:MAG: choice-of-anchor D domain-containing protein [Planctomycetaceae bacterium]